MRWVPKGFIVLTVTLTFAPVEWELGEDGQTWDPASLTKAGFPPPF